MSIAQLAAGRTAPSLVRRGASNDVVVRLSVAILTLGAAAAIFGPYLAPHDPDAIDLSYAFANPSLSHLLGTDDLGRDILSRLLVGARTALTAPLAVVLICVAVGTVLAIAAAWIGGWFDTAASRVMDVLFAFPGFILAVLAVAIFGTGLTAPIIALSISYIPLVARVLRTAALREVNLPYADALQVQGASTLSICMRHIVPNLAPLIVVQATVGYGYALLDLAAISYLGLGIQPPQADWGIMIADGQSSIIGGHPQQSLYASLCVVAVVVAANIVGDRLSQRFEIGER